MSDPLTSWLQAVRERLVCDCKTHPDMHHNDLADFTYAVSIIEAAQEVVKVAHDAAACLSWASEYVRAKEEEAGRKGYEASMKLTDALTTWHRVTT